MGKWRNKLRVFLAERKQRRAWMKWGADRPIPPETLEKWALHGHKISETDLARFISEVTEDK